MIKRENIEKKIISECRKHIAEPREKKIERQQRLFNDFDIPTEISNNILSLREVILSKYDEVILFAFSVEFGFEKEFYNENEIVEYSKRKYRTVSLSYPIILDAVKITTNQYVCCIKVTTLIDLFKNEKIIYNTDAQRATKKSAFNGVEYLTFDVNTKSVQEIAQLLIEHKFVRNTITLRANGIILYDQKKREIRINDDSTFDIIDGYHRLQGMVTANQLSPGCVDDETFEVRIVDFDDAVVTRFIDQENKRNKINRQTEKTMKASDGSSDVYDKLKMSSELSEIFQKKNVIIDRATSIIVIRALYFEYGEPKKSLSDIDRIYKEIKNGLTNYLSSSPELFSEPLDTKKTICMFVAISLEKSFSDFSDAYNDSLEIPNLYPTYSEVTKRSVTRVVKFFEERR